LLRGTYDQTVDRESAYELLAARAMKAQTLSSTSTGASTTGGSGGSAKGSSPGGGVLSDLLLGTGRREGLLSAAAKSVMRSASSSIGREIARGILGSLLGGKGKK
jgi:hypothetical protein